MRRGSEKMFRRSIVTPALLALAAVATLALTTGMSVAQQPFTEYPIPTAGSYPTGITVGPDGNLWFTESWPANKIGKVTTAGAVTEYSTPTANSNPREITTGPDGNLWFTEADVLGPAYQIGKVTPTGTFTEYPIPTADYPDGITTGPDGNLWFTELYANQIGKVTTSGTFTEYPIPTAGSGPAGITTGPD